MSNLKKLIFSICNVPQDISVVQSLEEVYGESKNIILEGKIVATYKINPSTYAIHPEIFIDKIQ